TFREKFFLPLCDLALGLFGRHGFAAINFIYSFIEHRNEFVMMFGQESVPLVRLRQPLRNVFLNAIEASEARAFLCYYLKFRSQCDRHGISVHPLASENLLVVLPQLRNYSKVFQRCRIAFHIARRREFPQQAAHDLSAARLRKHLRKAEVVWPRQRADFFGYPLPQLFLEFRAWLISFFERHEGCNRLPLHIVRTPDHCCFCDLGVRDQSRLDLHRTQPVSADVDNVIDAAHKPEVAVGVHACAVAGEIDSGNVREIGLLIPLRIAPDRPRQRGPWLFDDQQTAVPCGHGFTFFCHDFGHDAEERPCRRTRLCCYRAWYGSDHDRSRLGLPPRVDDGAFLFPDFAVIPHPGLGIDRLTHSAEQPQRGQRMFMHPLVAPLDERPDRCRRRVINAYLVIADELTEAVVLRPVRGAFVHHHGRAVLQRTVNHIAVACDPTDV